jgi:phosphatidylglycerol:prolipoprotein diacylglycerol transferase
VGDQGGQSRGLDEEKLLDAAPWLVLAGIVGARLVYVLTSPSAFFGPGGNPVDALKVWHGGISIHGGVLGIVVGMWIYSLVRRLDMWSYLDVMTPVGAFGIIGGRLGNFMNGSDTTGRLTGWPVGFTWPQPGTDTLGAFGRFVFGGNLCAGYPGTCSLGSNLPLFRCIEQGGEVLRGPVHLTQMYGVLVGLILIPILYWAFRRSLVSGFVFWQFVLWYSVLRSVIEEPFRDNPLYWNAYLSEGHRGDGKLRGCQGEGDSTLEGKLFLDA